MTDTAVLRLPVLPLNDTVLFPGMQLHMVADDPQQKALFTGGATLKTEGKVLFVPKVDNAFLSVGTIGKAVLSDMAPYVL